MIVCFSGTGNSYIVARRLSERLGDEIVMLGDLRSIAADLRVSNDRLIWVLPVHSWGLPKYVAKRLRNFGRDANAVQWRGEVKHFLVCTCGDDCGLIAKQWRLILKKYGWKGVAAHSVTMPNTYVTLPGFDVDAAEIAEEKMAKMIARVDRVAHAVKCSSPIDDVVKGRMAWLKSVVIYPVFMRFLTSPKPFCHDDRCIGCRRCAEVCPLGNVRSDSDGRPTWGVNCTLCLGCYHVCPHHAVAYGHATRHKGQWQGALRPLLKSLLK